MATKNTDAKLGSNQYIELDFNENTKRILILGNTEGMFGQYMFDETANKYFFNSSGTKEEAYEGIQYILDKINNLVRIDIVGNADTIMYYRNMMSALIDMGMTKFGNCKSSVHLKEIKNDKEYIEFMSKIQENEIEYDYIIQNPPYAKSLHLECLKKSLEILKKDGGKMTIIEPATWLINVRKNGKAKLYDEIKKMLEGHVSKVVIENMNIEFGTRLYVPFSITYIDYSQCFNIIDYICCGYTQKVYSLYDCNLIGNYNIIESIIKKITNDVASNHIYDGKNNKNGNYFTKYASICGLSGAGAFNGATNACADVNILLSNAWFCNDIYYHNGHMYNFYDTLYHHVANDISNMPIKSVKPGGKPGSHVLSDKNASCFTDTKEHLENWKHFVYNNKLPLFLNICLTIDQHNNSLDFVPWLVDRQYTDEEINELFQFTPEEIALIDKTIKKFERNSPWFKRYMMGKDSVSDEEVQKFVDSL